jgi:nitrous oxidase accessory protein
MRRCLYAFTFYMTLLFAINANARVYTAGSEQPIKTIKQALSIAASGDTILVYPGLYREQNIIIDKSVTLIGKNYPVLDGEKKYEIVSIKSSDVSFTGFKLIRCGHSDLDDLSAVKIYNARNVTVSGNILDDTFFGIYAQFARKCTIRNNRLSAYGKSETQIGNGVHCWKSDSMLITGNYITGHRDGIYFEFVTNSLIQSNQSISNVRYGLHFMFSHNDSYVSNVFRSNGAGVAVMYTKGIKMYNNTFENNWGDAAYGILLKDISDSHISGNVFKSNTTGIYMESSNRINMDKNLFANNGWAIKIQASCENNSITHSNFLGNTFDISTNSNLVLNTFNYNYWDKFEGYDLNKDKIGDVPYRPVSVYSMIVENNSSAMMLFRSFIVTLIDKSERILPGLIPENLKDDFPLMLPEKL